MGPEIGVGSFGHVYSGELNGQKVAVKTFLKRKVSDNTILDMRLESAILRYTFMSLFLFLFISY